jgi:hypothetical protein
LGKSKRRTATATQRARTILGIGERPEAEAIRVEETAMELRQAKEFFARFTALEAAFDPSLADCYAEDGVVIEKTLENGIEKRAREIPLQKYKAMLSEALAISARANGASTHADIRAERLAPGWVVIRSIRAYSLSRGPAPYEITVRRDASGGWRVVKEIAAVML